MDYEAEKARTLGYLDAITPRTTPWSTVLEVAKSMGADYYPKHEVMDYASYTVEPASQIKLLIRTRLRLILSQALHIRFNRAGDELPERVQLNSVRDETAIAALRLHEAETAERNQKRQKPNQ
jgi:hypothetical protein